MCDIRTTISNSTISRARVPTSDSFHCSVSPVGSADLWPLLLQRVHRNHRGAVQRGLSPTGHQMRHLQADHVAHRDLLRVHRPVVQSRPGHTRQGWPERHMSIYSPVLDSSDYLLDLLSEVVNFTLFHIDPPPAVSQGSHSTKVEAVVRTLKKIQVTDAGAKCLVFSTVTANYPDTVRFIQNVHSLILTVFCCCCCCCSCFPCLHSG